LLKTCLALRVRPRSTRDRHRSHPCDGFRKTGTFYLVFKEHRRTNRDYTSELLPVKGLRAARLEVPAPVRGVGYPSRRKGQRKAPAKFFFVGGGLGRRGLLSAG